VLDSLIGFSSTFASLGNNAHKSWFNKLKKMYYMNNIVVLDHCGLFIYLNNKYLGSFHDASYMNQTYTKINISYLYIGMDVLNIYWGTQVI
jgi:hypothetical protein